ncbi:MAG: Entericidin EcnA/B family protein [Pseudomonadota bacterium]|nr:Entericidin EcnA/B family protein [Pseudomonadota bacterium]
MARRVLAVLAVSVSLALAACNTVRGAAEDVKSVADAGDKVI